jgi:hypothetical protein
MDPKETALKGVEWLRTGTKTSRLSGIMAMNIWVPEMQRIS